MLRPSREKKRKEVFVRAVRSEQEGARRKSRRVVERGLLGKNLHPEDLQKGG